GYCPASSRVRERSKEPRRARTSVGAASAASQHSSKPARPTTRRRSSQCAFPPKDDRLSATYSAPQRCQHRRSVSTTTRGSRVNSSWAYLRQKTTALASSTARMVTEHASDSRPPTKNHPELLAWFQRQFGSRLARLFVNRHGCAGGVYRSDLNAWIAKAGTQHTASSKHDCDKPVERAPSHAIAA